MQIQTLISLLKKPAGVSAVVVLLPIAVMVLLHKPLRTKPFDEKKLSGICTGGEAMIACAKGRIEGLAYPEKFFGKVDWSDLVMTHVHLRRAVLKECRIVRSVFSYGDLSYADLSSCTLTENRFLHMRLTGVDFRGADLSGAEFYLTDLAQAKFDSTTRLPFSMKTALDLGMVHVSRD